jgi:hypothetical protein
LLRLPRLAWLACGNPMNTTAASAPQALMPPPDITGPACAWCTPWAKASGIIYAAEWLHAGVESKPVAVVKVWRAAGISA